VITGSLAELCYAKGMMRYLYTHDTRIFDYPQWTVPLRAAIRANAAAVAQAASLTIEYISKKDFRKEDRIQALLNERGSQPGLVHIFSAMEPCTSYRPWHDKGSGHTYLKPDTLILRKITEGSLITRHGRVFSDKAKRPQHGIVSR
jgi:hypothetical protein